MTTKARHVRWVRRTWNRDGTVNEMTLQAAISSVQAALPMMSKSAVSWRLLNGQPVKTRHAIFRVVPLDDPGEVSRK